MDKTVIYNYASHNGFGYHICKDLPKDETIQLAGDFCWIWQGVSNDAGFFATEKGFIKGGIDYCPYCGVCLILFADEAYQSQVRGFGNIQETTVHSDGKAE